MYTKITAFLLLFVAVLNFSYDFNVEAQPIEITLNTCLGRQQLNSAGEWQDLPDKGECYFNTFKEVNQWYAVEFANGREVYKKKARIQKIAEVQQAEKERGCMREPLCVLTKADCPTPPDWRSEKDQELCCARCYRLSALSNKGCIPNPNGCSDPDDPPITPVINWGLSGDWKGDCSGRGKYVPPVVGTSTVYDAWPSMTGCYTPEERFVREEVVVDSPMNPTPRPTIMVPDDWVLSLHPACAEKFSLTTTGGFLTFSDKNESTGLANEIICLGSDYQDDVDNFCMDFVRAGSYEKDRLVYKEECSSDAALSGWEIEKIAAIVAPSPPTPSIPEHYLPLAIELSSTHPTTPNFNLMGTPHSMQKYDLGEYGYNGNRVARGDPNTPSSIGGIGTSKAAPYEFNRRNIYNREYTDPDTGDPVYEVPDEEALSMNNRGVRAKRMDCLKVYIEQWAHRGDCGEIVIAGAQAGFTEGHCQWVAMYKADEAFLNFSITGVPGALTAEPRGLRSEYYDYENLNRTGWVKVIPEGTPSLQTTDICTFSVANGGGSRFWTPFDGTNRGKLDFAKRGCPTVSGPDIFPNFNCSSKNGAKVIDDNLNLTAGALLTTNISDGRALLWNIKTGGLGIPLVVMRALTNGSDLLLDDWVDYTHPARSCTTFIMIDDEYLETPDCKDLTCLGEHDGFLYKQGKKVYQWETNKPSLSNGSLWCEFDIPFNPYKSGGPSAVPFTEHMVANRKAEESYTTATSGGAPLLKLQFPMVERIRTACGAFNQRATWTQDDNSVLARFMVGVEGFDVGRCDEWMGYFAKKYEKVSTVSWRLPRFDYEFLKAFLQCTGPVRKAWKACDNVNYWTIAYNALPKQYGGCGCYWNFDDTTKPNNWYDEFDEDEAFGFWCKCRSDQFLTVKCNESFCTCQQKVILSHGMLTVCKKYGPFKRWLKCYYQARAKSCSVLTRDVSNGIVGSLYTLEAPCDPSEDENKCESMKIKDFDGNDPITNVADAEVVASNYAEMCPGSDPPIRAGSLRWQAPEPNILARLPVRSDGGASIKTGPSTEQGVYKHHDLVYMSQTRDIYPPFMEPTIPWPLEVAENAGNCPGNPLCGGVKPGDFPVYDSTTGFGVKLSSLNTSPEYVDAMIMSYMKGLVDVSDAFAETDLGDPSRPSPRAQETIVGPRGCDIGGWYEMMLYQARCIKLFKLNCICEYSKTFAMGSAESYVLLKGGMEFNTARPYIVDGGDTLIDVTITDSAAGDDKLGDPLISKVYWPLMSRGQVGPYYARNAQPGSKLWDKKNIGQDGALASTSGGSSSGGGTSYPAVGPNIDWVDDGTRDTVAYEGLSEAQYGDFMILDETIKNKPWLSPEHVDYDSTDADNFPVDNRFDARYRRHVAFVESITGHENDLDGDMIVQVSEYNFGKNMDSCGNTDRWSKVTVRNIHKSPDVDKVWDAASATWKFCSNPDWKDCFEPNWERIKLYRPSLDVVELYDPTATGSSLPPKQIDLPRPVCYNRDWEGKLFLGPTNPLETVTGSLFMPTPDYQPFFPRPITTLNLNSRLDTSGLIDSVPSSSDLLSMSPYEAIITEAWKRKALGYFDDMEVRLFLSNKVGRCDPPVEFKN